VHRIKKVVAISVLAALVATSCVNQWRYNLGGIFERDPEIFRRLLLSDAERHERSAGGQVLKVADSINKLPADSVLFFVPVFPDTPGARANTIQTPGAGPNTLWWWHLYNMLRYFCYPRMILTFNEDACNDKTAFLKEHVGDKKLFSDIDWISSRKVTQIIVYKDNAITVLPVSAPVDF